MKIKIRHIHIEKWGDKFCFGNMSVCVSFISVKWLEVWKSFIHLRISLERTAFTRLELLNEWECMYEYAWKNKREESYLCFAVVWFGLPPPPLLASKDKPAPALWVREKERGCHCGCISCGGEGGRTQIRWQQKRFGIFHYYIPSRISCVLCAAEVAVHC
jgi:hypothetical protein